MFSEYKIATRTAKFGEITIEARFYAVDRSDPEAPARDLLAAETFTFPYGTAEEDITAVLDVRRAQLSSDPPVPG